MAERLCFYDAAKLAQHMHEKTIIFQDAVDAGFGLPEVEAWSDYLVAAGKWSVTAAVLIDLRTDATYGEMNAATLNVAVDRLETELHDDVFGHGNWTLRHQ